MLLTDSQINVFVSKVLHLGVGERKKYITQIDYLIEELTKKINQDSSFKVKGFKKTGSIVKGTVLKPKGDLGVDADIAIFLNLDEAEKNDIEKLHQIICKLLYAVYPTKDKNDFKIQPRTLGIHFLASGLDVDLVPVIPILSEPDYGWQPSSDNGDAIKTSIHKQIDFIRDRKKKDPRFKTLIRLLKKWRNEQELESLRSFTIELILAHIYDQEGTAPSLEEGLLRFFLYVARYELKTPISFPENGIVTSFPDDKVIVLDPVNKENNVAKRITEDQRLEIVQAAKVAWETISTASTNGAKGETLDLWKEIFGRSFTIEED